MQNRRQPVSCSAVPPCPAATAIRTGTALWLALALSAVSTAAETIWLSSLDLTRCRQGWGTAQADRSVTEKPITISGHTFAHGLGTHAVSTLWVDLHGETQRFQASVGLDDTALNSPGSVTFRLVADGKTVWKSGLMKAGQPAKECSVELKGVKTLLLMVGDADDGSDHDHADWADARFTVTGSAPKTMDPPVEPAVVLTPPAPPTPRINGPRVFGVRPSSPVLYTIPASGDRPMRFGVTGLPLGLSLDPITGQISGHLAKTGDYSMVLQATNALGRAERPFKIVCGDTLALTPHMGWNSWYVWENHVTDAIMRAAADAMVSSGMSQHGYSYVNIDDCWAVKPGTAPLLCSNTRRLRLSVWPI